MYRRIYVRFVALVIKSQEPGNCCPFQFHVVSTIGYRYLTNDRPARQGWNWTMALKNLGFKFFFNEKPEKSKIEGFYFFGEILYISYLISYLNINRDLWVLLKFIANDVTERTVYWMFFLGWNFVSGLICTLKSKKTKT